ncbi:MAG: helix-turn-helix domain protein [Blastococcus sp.]|nr:helix-turn-helix domain protein [Blastococcus sp.]
MNNVLHAATETEGVSFHDATQEIDAALADPAKAAKVEAVRAEMAQEDRVYAMNLAMMRQAAALTQEEVAGRLRIGQSAVARTEKADDLLLSTLRRYVESVGAHVTVVVRLADGKRVELDLEALTE